MQIKRGDLVIIKSGNYGFTNPGSFGIAGRFEPLYKNILVNFLHIVGKDVPSQMEFGIPIKDLRLMTKLEKLIHGIEDVRRDD